MIFTSQTLGVLVEAPTGLEAFRSKRPATDEALICRAEKSSTLVNCVMPSLLACLKEDAHGNDSAPAHAEADLHQNSAHSFKSLFRVGSRGVHCP